MKRNALIAKRIALLLLLQLLFAASTPATSIVVRRTPEEIVVGADSKRVITGFVLKDGKTTPTEVASDNVCKIGSSGDTFFAIGGYAKARATDTPDPEQLAIQACHARQTIMDRAVYFEQTITPKLAEHFEELRRLNPDYLKERWATNPILGVVFFGFEGGIPKVVYFEFSANVYGPVTVAVRRFSCPGVAVANGPATSCGGEGAMMIGAGIHDAIDTFIDGREDFWQKVGSVEGVRRLIQIQSIATPEQVGGPIDIIRIDKTGATWIQRKPECEEEKALPTKPTYQPTRRRPPPRRRDRAR